MRQPDSIESEEMERGSMVDGGSRGQVGTGSVPWEF